MSHVIVLFNLKPGTDAAAYEAWAKATDLPVVRGLASIAGFDLFKASGRLMSDEAPPYAYVELIEIRDMEAFGQDVGSPLMQRVAAEFQQFADNPIFVLTDKIG
jgi:hypothetical protein